MPTTQLSTSLVKDPAMLTADGRLQLFCPRSWGEMTQQQLRYALHLIGCGMYSPVEMRTLLLLRFTGISVDRKTPYGWAATVPVVTTRGKIHRHHFYLHTWQVQDMIGQLEYVGSYDTMNVRLESIQGFKAVDVLLHKVLFGDYLNMEKYYQGYLATKEEKYALGLARLLYPGGVTSISDAELTGCIMWFSYVKKHFSKLFHHFFKPVPEGGKVVNWMEQMNAQIRALTDGDITKERTVLDADCWRALTELDAKAREAEEFRKKYPKS